MKNVNESVKPFAVAIVILFGLLLSAVIWFRYLNTTAEPEHEIYPTSAIVTEITDDLVTITDFEGRMWQFYDDCEDWMIGDICAVIMDNNSTNETVYDDIILQTRYCGWVE